MSRYVYCDCEHCGTRYDAWIDGNEDSGPMRCSKCGKALLGYPCQKGLIVQRGINPRPDAISTTVAALQEGSENANTNSTTMEKGMAKAKRIGDC